MTTFGTSPKVIWMSFIGFHNHPIGLCCGMEIGESVRIKFPHTQNNIHWWEYYKWT
jgi:hypothetical protein